MPFLRPIFPLAVLLSLAIAGPARLGAETQPVPPFEQAGEADATEVLIGALRMDDLMELTRTEGAAQGKKLEEQFFPGAGGAAWAAEVARIYDPVRLMPVFRAAFADDLARTGAATAPMTAFLTSALGRRITGFEIEARAAMLDDAVEDAGRQAYEELQVKGGARPRLLDELIAANHLIDMNLSSALNANVAFMRGLSESGALGERMTEEELLAEVWSQDQEVRSQTEDWLTAFVTLAYAPLSDDELKAYVAFSASPEGAALNRALFAGFDAAYVRVSAALGQAVGQRMKGTTL